LLSEVENTRLRVTAKKAVRVSYEIANTILRETKNPDKSVVDGMYVIYRLLSGDRVTTEYLRELKHDLIQVDGEFVEWLCGIFAQMVYDNYNNIESAEYMIIGSLCGVGDLVRDHRGLSGISGYGGHDSYDEVSLELCEIIRANFGCPTVAGLRMP